MTSLHSSIENVIQQRLETSQIFIDDSLYSQNINKLTCSKKTNLNQQSEYIYKLCQSSFTVSDEDMVKALDLKVVKNEPSELAIGTAHFYIRSLKISVQQMNLVLSHYEELYNDNDFVTYWKGVLSQKSSDIIIYLRYIGTTFRSPYKRSKDSNYIQSRVVNFEKTLKEVLSNNFTFYIFGIPLLSITKSTSSFIIHQNIVDVTEIWLIHLFGREHLLNSQPDGKFIYYLPNKQVMDSILTLNLQLVFNEENPSKKSKTLKSSINKSYSKINFIYNNYYKEMMKENNNFNDDNAITKKLTSRYMDMLVFQTINNEFSIKNKITPLVLFGLVIPTNEFNNCASFLLNNSSRSSMFIRQLLNTINKLADTSLPSTILPFLNLYLVPKMIDESLHINTSAYLLQELKSIIVATFGYEPAATAYSNFHGR